MHQKDTSTIECGDCGDANEGIKFCYVANGFCCNGAGVCTINANWPGRALSDEFT